MKTPITTIILTIIMKSILAQVIDSSVIVNALGKESDVDIVFHHPQFTHPDKFIRSQNHQYFILTDDLGAGYLSYGVFQVSPPLLMASGVLGIEDEKCITNEVVGISDNGKFILLVYECTVFGVDYRYSIYDIDNDSLIRNVDPIWINEDDQPYYYFNGLYGFEESSGPDNLLDYSDKETNYTAEYINRVVVREHVEYEYDYYDKDNIVWESEKQRSSYYAHGSTVFLEDETVIISEKEKKEDDENFYWYDFANKEKVYSTANPFGVIDLTYLENDTLFIMYSGYPYVSIDSEVAIDLKTGAYNNTIFPDGTVAYERRKKKIVYLDKEFSSGNPYFLDAHTNLYSVFRTYYRKDGTIKDSSVYGQILPEFYPKHYWNIKLDTNLVESDLHIHSSYNNKVVYCNMIPYSLWTGLLGSKYRQEINLMYWNGDKKDPSQRKVNMMYLMDGGPFFYTDDRHYMAHTNLSGIVSFKSQGKLYPFEQFDLKFNRPDIILDRLGYADSLLIDAYHKAYLKRLRKMGFTEVMLKDDFHLPEIEIENFAELPIVSDGNSVKLSLKMHDRKYKLDRINVWVNDIPIYGLAGISLRNYDTSSFKIDLPIELSYGKNKIQVSVLNRAGAESFKQTVNVKNKMPEKADIYIVVISVSEYKDEQFDLKYAVKDGRDIVSLYSNMNDSNFENIIIDTLFNTDVTLENVLSLKKKLLGSKIDDQVILYVSGHGLLDNYLDFYFASHDMDFSDPALRGISYESLESLLDSIPARKKLFLMDACHSGEVDKEELKVIADTTVLLADGKKSGLKSYSYRGANTITSGNDETKVGLQNSFELMQELFTNLNRGSGAQVISAAAGDSYALESNEWNNGVFTYAIINGLKNNAADTDGNGDVSVSELRSYVIEQVQELTNGKQKPTSRQENVEFDFKVW